MSTMSRALTKKLIYKTEWSHLLAMTEFSDAILPGLPGVTNEVRVKAAADVLEFVVWSETLAKC